MGVVLSSVEIYYIYLYLKDKPEKSQHTVQAEPGGAVVNSESDQAPVNHVPQVTATARHSNVRVKGVDATGTIFLHELVAKVNEVD